MKSFWKKKFIWDVSMAILIMVLPYVLLIHTLFDTNKNFIVCFGFKYFHGYQGNDTFLYLVLSIGIICVLLALWFVNNSRWWGYFILFPLVVWLDRYFRKVFKNLDFIKENEIVFSIVVNLFVIGLLIVIKKRLYSKEVIGVYMFQYTKGFLGLKLFYTSIHQQFLVAEKVENDEEYLGKRVKSKMLIQEKLSNFFIKESEFFKKKPTEFFFAFVLFLTPFLTYTSDILSTQHQETLLLTFGLFDFAQYYSNNWFFIWFITVKISLLIQYIIWFVSQNEWWRFAILSPIVLTIYQFAEVFGETQTIDESSFLRAVPIIGLVICFILLFFRAINYKSKILNIYDELSSEIEVLLQKVGEDKTMLYQQKFQFSELTKSKTKSSEKLKQLLQLKKELQDELENKSSFTK